MAEVAIHATAVAIDGAALLIRGASRSGKSRLAADLIRRSTDQRAVVLVGDDRILLAARAGALMARPHPRIAGFLERRGLGIVAVPWAAQAPVRGAVELSAPLPDVPLLRGLPCLAMPGGADDVLAWWTWCAQRSVDTGATQCGENRRAPVCWCAKD